MGVAQGVVFELSCSGLS